MMGQEVPVRQNAARAVTTEAILNMIGTKTDTVLRPSPSGDRVSVDSKAVWKFGNSG